MSTSPASTARRSWARSVLAPMRSRPPLSQRREWRLASGTRGRSNAGAARYAAAGRDYAPSGAPFANVGDLGAVIGMTPELLARLLPHLTVFTDSDPGPTTRDPVVARALAAVGQRDVNVGEFGAGLVSVTADARRLGRARFALHVIVRTNGPPFEILARERFRRDQP